MARMVLPMVIHSEPLMTPMFFTLSIVKKRSLSALSFQFLFMSVKDAMIEARARRSNGNKCDGLDGTADMNSIECGSRTR